MDHELSLDDRKLLSKCKIEYIDINTNLNMCTTCPNTVMDQRYLLECKYIVWTNEIVLNIQTYKDLPNGDLEEQSYISQVLKEKL